MGKNAKAKAAAAAATPAAPAGDLQKTATPESPVDGAKADATSTGAAAPAADTPPPAVAPKNDQRTCTACGKVYELEHGALRQCPHCQALQPIDPETLQPHTVACARCEAPAVTRDDGPPLCLACLNAFANEEKHLDRANFEPADTDRVSDRVFAEAIASPVFHAFVAKHLADAQKVLRTGPAGGGWRHNESKRAEAEVFELALRGLSQRITEGAAD